MTQNFFTLGYKKRVSLAPAQTTVGDVIDELASQGTSLRGNIDEWPLLPIPPKLMAEGDRFCNGLSVFLDQPGVELLADITNYQSNQNPFASTINPNFFTDLHLNGFDSGLSQAIAACLLPQDELESEWAGTDHWLHATSDDGKEITSPLGVVSKAIGKQGITYACFFVLKFVFYESKTKERGCFFSVLLSPVQLVFSKSSRIQQSPNVASYLASPFNDSVQIVDSVRPNIRFTKAASLYNYKILSDGQRNLFVLDPTDKRAFLYIIFDDAKAYLTWDSSSMGVTYSMIFYTYRVSQGRVSFFDVEVPVSTAIAEYFFSLAHGPAAYMDFNPAKTKNQTTDQFAIVAADRFANARLLIECNLHYLDFLAHCFNPSKAALKLGLQGYAISSDQSSKLLDLNTKYFSADKDHFYVLPGVILVFGESGSGKSELVKHFLNNASSQGISYVKNIDFREPTESYIGYSALDVAVADLFNFSAKHRNSLKVLAVDSFRVEFFTSKGAAGKSGFSTGVYEIILWWDHLARLTNSVIFLVVNPSHVERSLLEQAFAGASSGLILTAKHGEINRFSLNSRSYGRRGFDWSFTTSSTSSARPAVTNVP